MNPGSIPHLLLVQVKNDIALFVSGIVNQDLREYRINLLKKYPQMKDFLLERFFGIPGIGYLMIEAIGARDYNVINAMTFISSILFPL